MSRTRTGDLGGGSGGGALPVAILLHVLVGCSDGGHSSGPVDGASPRSTTPSVWVDDLVPDGLRLGKERAGAAMRFVRTSLSATPSAGARLPEELRSDRAPRVVILSVTSGEGPADVSVGAGEGFCAALEDALEGVPERPPEAARNCWVKLDLVRGVGQLRELGDRSTVDFERSLEGLAFSGKPRLAFLPEELVARSIIDSDGTFRVSRANAYLRARRGAQARAAPRLTGRSYQVRALSTESYFLEDGEAVPLYRGHRMYRDLTGDLLIERARAAGEYLRRSVGRDGRFVYSYLPASGAESAEYNMVRHAGTAYSMLELVARESAPGLMEVAGRALGYLLEYIRPFGTGQQAMSVLVYGGKIKLGGVALAAVALAEHCRVTEREDYLEVAQRLCRYIVWSQREDGSFVHQRDHPSGEPRSFRSEYYPGEALLALVRVHALDGDSSWLDAAEKGAHYLIEVRDRGLPIDELTHDHWLCYALDGLYRVRPEPMYLEQSLRIARAMARKQKRSTHVRDHVGSYYEPPRSTPTATRTEGLLAVHALARYAGREDAARSILESAEMGVRFQLQTQVTPERAMYMKEPRRAAGGFTRGLTHLEIRIDYVQHNLSALLLLHEVMARAEAAEQAPR